jgi:anti-anti-sigma factor
MQISIVDQSDSTARVILAGKCDMAGAKVIAAPLATLAESKQAILVDLSGVTFITSKGVHQFVLTSKALGRRGGRLVLLNPNPMVTDVLASSGVNALMDVVHSESAAEAALKPHT